MCPSSGGGEGGGGAEDEKHLVLPRFHQQDTECEMWMKRNAAEEEDKEGGREGGGRGSRGIEMELFVCAPVGENPS